MKDAFERAFKVDVAKRYVEGLSLGTRVSAIATDLATPSAVRAIAECDIVFGCMDGAEGRHLLNRIAAFYLLPYFDLGVRLDADGRGGVEQVPIQADGEELGVSPATISMVPNALTLLMPARYIRKK